MHNMAKKQRVKPKSKSIMVALNTATGTMIAFKSKTALASIVGCHRNSIKAITIGMELRGFKVIEIPTW
jgi:hypothetical protein